MATLQQIEQLLFEVDRLLTWMEYSLHGAIMNDNLSWQYYGTPIPQHDQMIAIICALETFMDTSLPASLGVHSGTCVGGGFGRGEIPAPEDEEDPEIQ